MEYKKCTRGYIIYSNQSNIGNVNSKYHNTADYTKRHIDIHL